MNNLDEEKFAKCNTEFDEAIQRLKRMIDNDNWGTFSETSDNDPSMFGIYISKEKYIKQLKQQVKHAKNPMEIKKLNQKIMELQKELNKSRKVK